MSYKRLGVNYYFIDSFIFTGIAQRLSARSKYADPGTCENLGFPWCGKIKNRAKLGTGRADFSLIRVYIRI